MKLIVIELLNLKPNTLSVLSANGWFHPIVKRLVILKELLLCIVTLDVFPFHWRQD